MTVSTGRREARQASARLWRAFLAAEYGRANKAADLVPALAEMAPHITWTAARIHNEAATLGLSRPVGKDDGRGPLSHADRDHMFLLAIERAGIRFDRRVGV